MIVKRDREQRPFIKFVRLAKAFKRAKKEGRGQAIQEKIETRKRLGVILASCTGKDRDSKSRES